MARVLFIVCLIALGGCGNAIDGAKPLFRVAGMAELNSEDDAKKQGIKHFAARDYGLAVKYFRLAVAQNPVSIEALNGLAASYDQLARYDVAERYYRRALDLDPHSLQTLNNVGFSYYLQGKLDLAHAYLADAMAVGKDDAAVYANGLCGSLPFNHLEGERLIDLLTSRREGAKSQDRKQAPS